MSITVSEAITQVRSLLDEPIENFWKDTEITAWLDAGQRQICSDVGIEATTTVNIAGPGTYAVTPAFKNVWMVEVIGTTHAKLIAGRDYIFYGNTLTMLANYSGTAKIYGTKDPGALTSSFEVSDDAVTGCIYYAVAHAVRKDEAFNEDNTYMALFRDCKARREKVYWDNVNMQLGPMHYYDRARQGLPGGGGAPTSAAST